MPDVKDQEQKLDQLTEEMIAKIQGVVTTAVEGKADSDQLTTMEERMVKQIADGEKELKELMDTKLKEIVAKVSRPTETSPLETNVESPAMKAFGKFLRKGDAKMTEEELAHLTLSPEKKTLMLADDSAAGYLAMPDEYVAEIIKHVTEFSPIRTVAKIRTTGRTRLSQPRRTAAAVASWDGEGETTTEDTTLKFGLETIDTHGLRALYKATAEMLEDSAFNMEAVLRDEFAEAFGYAEGTAFVSGAAGDRPIGLLTDPDVSSDNSGISDALKADGLITLFYALNDQYVNNRSRWLMRRATMAAIAKFKDSTGQYLLTNGDLSQGRPTQILGYPVVHCPDMPAVAADAYPIAWGDFYQGYTILDRIMMAIIRDPYTSKTTATIEFMARKRVGGKTVNPNAYRLQKVSA